MLPQDLVFFLLPKKLILGAMRLEVLNQVASGVGKVSEKASEFLGRNIEVFLKSLQEVVVSILVVLFV